MTYPGGQYVVPPYYQPTTYVEPARFLSPIKDKYTVTDKFKDKAGRPKDRPHCGVDLVCPEGIPIYAVGEGELLLPPGKDEVGGNWVVIIHKGGIRSEYCHLRDACTLKKGDKVDNNTVIGYVGHTGHTPGGPHLHFGISIIGATQEIKIAGIPFDKYNITYVNPADYVQY